MFPLTEAISLDERCLETHQATASLAENREISIQGSADSSESVANTEPQSSPNDGAITPASDQKTEPPPPPQLPPSPEKPGKMSSQTRRSRISKIKPNPVLRQTSRPIRSKTQPEALKESVEINAPAPSSSETTEIPPAAEVNKTELSQRLPNEVCEEKVPEADEIVTPGRTSESTDSALDKPANHASISELNTVKDSAVPQTRRSRFQKAKPNLPMTARPKSQTAQDSKSTPDPPQKSDVSAPGKNQDLGLDSSEKKTDPELMVQLHSNVATADLIASDNERTQEAPTEISSMSTEEQIDSHRGGAEPSLGAPVQETSDHPASGDLSAEAPAGQREESVSPSTRPVRKSRFQKVKPKPNLPSTPRSVRCNPTSTSNAENANCNPPSTPRSHEETVGEVPGSVAIPTLDARLTAAEAEQTDVDQNTSVTKDLPVQPEEQRTHTPAPTPKTGGELSEMVESAGAVGPGSAAMSLPVQESRHPPPSKDQPVSQEEEDPTCQTGKGQRVKHRPNLLQTSGTVQSTPQSTEEPVERSSGPGSKSCLISVPQKDQTAPAKSPETSATSEASSTAENQGENVGSSESAAKNEPQKRRRFPKAKPNLGSSARNIPTKPHPSDARKASEQHHGDACVTAEQLAQVPLQAPEQDGEPSASTGMSRDGQKNEAMTSDSVAMAMQAVAAKEAARTESNTPASADISEGQSSENVPAETDMKSVTVEPSEWKGRDSGSAETAEDGSLAQR